MVMVIKMSLRSRLIAAVLFGYMPISALAAPPSLTTIYDFSGDVYGMSPTSGLVSDPAGNLFGTVPYSGAEFCTAPSCVSVFELSPPVAGQTNWTMTVLYQLSNGGKLPIGGLARDPATGTLYGTSPGGGTGVGCGDNGCGFVFKIDPPKNGQGWAPSVIYNFTNDGYDGIYPTGTLFFGPQGRLYGTTSAGGNPGTGAPGGFGTVFKMTPPGYEDRFWSESRVWAFSNGPDDGRVPLDGVIADAAGNLFGTSSAGPTSATCGGSIFKLTPPAHPNPRTYDALTNLYHLAGGAIGCQTTGALLQDANGVFYGTTLDGGPSASGAVYTLSPPQAGQTAWTPSVIHSFAPGNKGDHPYGGVISDKVGKLYGTTAGYATKTYPVRGASVFSLVPPNAGGTTWTWKHLITFDGANGASPMSGLVIAHDGKLYGTTASGGANNLGTVFGMTR